jgi:cyclase
MTRLPVSTHFVLHELAGGVYAAIHAPGGAAIGNAGIIDTGDRTLVFDTGMSPRAARDLLDAAETLTGRPASIVLNSHDHNDHTWGNAAVPAEVDIVATAITRDLVARGEEEQWYREHAGQSLSDARVQRASARNATEREQQQVLVEYYEAIVDALPLLPPRTPNITFQDTLEFTGPRRCARFIARAGHSASDAMLHLPDDGVLFMGDLLFVRVHPYLGDGDPNVLRQTLAEVKALGAGVLVPGHGPVGGIADADAMLRYIDELQASVERAVRDGSSCEEIEQQRVPDQYAAWQFPSFYEQNAAFLYRRYTVDK